MAFAALQCLIMKVFACATFARLQAFQCAVKRALHTKVVQKSHINPWLWFMQTEQCVRFHWHWCHYDSGNEWYLVDVKPLFVAQTSVFVLSTLTIRILDANKKMKISFDFDTHITVGVSNRCQTWLSHSKVSAHLPDPIEFRMISNANFHMKNDTQLLAISPAFDLVK